MKQLLTLACALCMGLASTPASAQAAKTKASSTHKATAHKPVAKPAKAVASATPPAAPATASLSNTPAAPATPPPAPASQPAAGTDPTETFFQGAYPTKVNFNKGNLFVQGGLGLLSWYSYSSSTTSVPPLFAAAEYAVTDRIGLGGTIGYTSSKWTSRYAGSEYGWRFSYVVFGARGTYHFVQTPKWDTYGGLFLGYNAASAKYTSPEGAGDSFKTPLVGGVVGGGFVGARYFFTPQVAVMGELGYQMALLNLGVCFKVQ